MKRCTRCDAVKELGMFPRDRTTKTGRDSWCKDCHAEYREANREALRARSRDHYARNREKVVAKVLAYQRTPEGRASFDAYTTRRRMIESAAVEAVDRFAVFVRDGGVCGICGDPVDPTCWHLDHVVPLALGGAHTFTNVQVAHPQCNMRKGVRLTGRAQLDGSITDHPEA